MEHRSVRCTTTGDVWVGPAPTLGSMRDRIWLSVRQGPHPNARMRATWHGHGLYPRPLQAIVRAEGAERSWMRHAPENPSSGAETQNTGFQAVGQLAFGPDGTVGLLPIGVPARAHSGAALLGMPLLETGDT